jgi:DNA invertase Pin-like site-specific DNA recombinase
MHDKNEQKPIAILYARVSTGRQAREGFSLDSQHALLAHKAKQEGYEIRAIADTASGRDSRRPALNKALRQLEAKEAAALFALDIDRLARSTLHLLEIARSSQNQGWRLVITSANVDTSTPAGEMFFTLAAAFAQYESRMISQRILRQHEARRERGEIWGYTSGPVSPLSKEVIAQIVHMRSSGDSYNGIARELTLMGLPTARGGKWHAATIRDILHSPAVKHRFGGH